MGRNIFMTGGTGFFGKSMLDYRRRHAEWAQDAWTILSRDPGDFMARNVRLVDQPNLRFVTGDVRDFDFPSGHFDAVIHAATPAVTTLEDDEMTSIVVEGTRHVLEMAKHCGAEKFMLTSSGAVYGPGSSAVDEASPCNPATAYGKGKLLAEQMCRASGLHVLLPRCFAFVGRYLNRGIHFAVGNFIKNCLENAPIVIKGDGTPLRSYLYADDLVEWLFAILDKGESGRPYNVGSDCPMSIREVAEKVKQALNSQSEISVLGGTCAGASSVYVPVVERARIELGLFERTSFEDAVRASAVG